MQQRMRSVMAQTIPCVMPCAMPPAIRLTIGLTIHPTTRPPVKQPSLIAAYAQVDQAFRVAQGVDRACARDHQVRLDAEVPSGVRCPRSSSTLPPQRPRFPRARMRRETDALPKLSPPRRADATTSRRRPQATRAVVARRALDRQVASQTHAAHVRTPPWLPRHPHASASSHAVEEQRT